jgi:hypothetical protein
MVRPKKGIRTEPINEKTNDNQIDNQVYREGES